MATKWMAVATVQSQSNPEQSYRISVSDKGILGCSCPSWRFSPVRTCKHIAKQQDVLVEMVRRRGMEVAA